MKTLLVAIIDLLVKKGVVDKVTILATIDLLSDEEDYYEHEEVIELVESLVEGDELDNDNVRNELVEFLELYIDSNFSEESIEHNKVKIFNHIKNTNDKFKDELNNILKEL